MGQSIDELFNIHNTVTIWISGMVGIRMVISSPDTNGRPGNLSLDVSV